MLTKDELPECPVATVIEIIGYKWRLLILQHLRTKTYRFNELLKALPGISQKVLTDNLRSLESNGLVSRKIYPEVPPHVEYSLTELGDSLNPMFESIRDWGKLYKDFIIHQELSN